MSANLLDKSKVMTNTRRLSGLSKTVRSKTANSNKKDSNDGQDNHVRVAIRCRPMSEKEIGDGHESIVEFESDTRIVVHDTSATPSDQLGTKSGERRNISHVYDFDAVFDCTSSQKDVYDSVCKPIVDSVLEGYNGTIFAYGQTGTGKTYTMEGFNARYQRRKSSIGTTSAIANNNYQKESIKNIRSNSAKRSTSINEPTTNLLQQKSEKETAGIIPRAFEQIFNHVAKSSNVQFLIRASYLEIYQEEIHDLLRKDRTIKLELHERPDIGVYVKDLTSFVCKSITEIERVMRVGNQNRIVGATDMNEHSSRSHAIFVITVERQQMAAEGLESNLMVSDGPRVIKVGKLNLVDLAGSERQRKTNSFGQRQRESIKINLSLSALGNVINSLMKANTSSQQQQQSSYNTNDSFTPYRDSKLTRLLQDSLGGNAKTLMIANIGPASYNYDETINTLNYASRAKCIRNKPRINEDPKDALLRELQKEIDDLRSKLAAINSKNGSINSNRIGKVKTNQTSKNSDTNSKTTDENYVDGENVRIELIELKQKLSSLENKLLNGNKYQQENSDSSLLNQSLLKGYTEEQELELEKSRAELANQTDREKAIRDELERREEAEMLAKESFSSIQQEVDAKKRLLRQILIKIKVIRDSIENTQRSYRVELDELDQLQYVLQKELKLKCLIMDNFIPNNHVDQLLPRIVYDDKRNSCTIVPIDLPLDYCNLEDDCVVYSDIWQPSDDCIRPKSEFERIGETIYPSNIRYKYENIIEPKLEMPSINFNKRELNVSKTFDRDEKQTSLDVHMLLDKALDQHEQDIII